MSDAKHAKAAHFPIETMRHTCAHLMAAAIQSLWPEAKFGVGPAIDNGFYYDVCLNEPIKETDLPRIEKAMQKIAKRRLPLVRTEVSIEEAIQTMQGLNQPYKVELLKLLQEKGSTAIAKETGDNDVVETNDSGKPPVISFYQLGEFTDLCRGPHVENSGQVGVFKVTRLAGAYWRGNENNDMLQRIYGLCYATQEELDAELWRQEQVKLRDHRKIGKQLKIFTFSEDVGAGLPLWLPNGTVLREELELLAKIEENKDGYERVVTPQITKEKLYYRSGHLPYYSADMYSPIQIEEEKFYLRPMNCPHHHQVYLSDLRAYRQLPLRFSEYGQVYRYESSGALSGLMRTRAFCQNDAHIYCRFDQAKEEFTKVMHLHARYYKLFNLNDYYMRLSLPDMNHLDKYVNEPEKWKEALKIIKEAMEESGYPFVEVEGEAAFYGPKVDFMIKSVIGTEYAISTNQLDFLATERFDLNYIAEDGQKHPVYVIHRAPLGSHERFVAFLIEHYMGAFPTWLAPVQARIIPIGEDQVAYAKTILDKCRSSDIRTATGGLRVDMDQSPERMQKKIREAQLEKIPYMLVVGAKEQETNTIAVRLRSGKDLGAIHLDEFLKRIKQEIETRQNLHE
ncbi:MAG: threonine--tRNA ligase [Proteobacteria bacterium]|nr:threonine--tRNA ligase [Pseudomonadota bacterium]